MPCRDYYDDNPGAYYADTIKGLQKQVSFAESALCQTLRALEHVDSQVDTVSPKTGEWYDWIDFKAAGIKKEDLVAWHVKHKALDEKHRAEEKAKADAAREKERLKKIKQDLLKKLTADEKKALGLK